MTRESSQRYYYKNREKILKQAKEKRKIKGKVEKKKVTTKETTYSFAYRTILEKMKKKFGVGK